MKPRGDYVGALILVALGATFAAFSVDYGILGEGARIGPGFVPCVVGLLLIVFGATIGWETWQSRVQAAATNLESDTPSDATINNATTDDAPPHNTTKAVTLIFTLLFVAVILAPILGFLLTFTILVFAILAGVEREHIGFSFAISLGIGLLAWLVFYKFMGIRLPMGISALLTGG